jgi:hypothetical protein
MSLGRYDERSTLELLTLLHVCKIGYIPNDVGRYLLTVEVEPVIGGPIWKCVLN